MNAAPPQATPALEPIKPALGFGPFLLYRTQRRLLDNGQPVRIGSRALDLLIVLVEHAGQVLSRDELMRHLWPREVVEENTLRVHVAALRKALGSDQHQGPRIVNVPGRGYSFVAEVFTHHDSAGALPPVPPSATRLPPVLARIVGRGDVVATLSAQLLTQRFVSIVGAGGLGKTSVALMVAEAVSARHAQGAWFVDLSTVATSGSVTEAFSSALNVPTVAGHLESRLLKHIATQQALIVVDNCEHVLVPLALLIERILDECPQVRILATTREPVRAAGEWVHLLTPLTVPPDAAPLNVQEALRFSAVQLFAERARAGDDRFELTEENLAEVVEVCRQLDGIPLAIEFTAALVRAFSLRGVMDGLAEKLLALSGGRRMAASRHQTLHAMLDWSHQLLSPVEKRVLHHLSVFTTGMSMDCAVLVAGDDALGLSPTDVRLTVAALGNKSWLYADALAEPVRFHMHGMARAFAQEQLRASGAWDHAARRHADHMQRKLQEARLDWPRLDHEAWLARYAPFSVDVLAAVSRTLAQPDGLARAEALMSDAWVLGFQLHQLADHVVLARQILKALEDRGGDPMAELRMHRIIALLDGPQISPRTRDTFHGEKALALAKQIGSQEQLISCLLINFFENVSNGNFKGGLDNGLYLQARSIHPSDAQATSSCERMLAVSHHLLGHHDTAQELARRVVAHQGWKPSFDLPASVMSQQAGAQIVLARTAWLQGRPDSADALCRELVQAATDEDDMALSQLIGLAALPVALWRGDMAHARTLSRRLREEAVRRGLMFEWAAWLEAIDTVIELGLDSPRCARAIHANSNLVLVDHAATFSRHSLDQRGLERAHKGLVGWCAPEVMRAQALAWLETEEASPSLLARAETQLQESLRQARQQGALAWALRSATSLAQRWAVGPKAEEGQALLASVLAQFTEGHGTRDLLLARAVLNTPRPAH